MRDFKITRNEGEWYHATVTDSYGNKYDNHFEFAHEANDWIYYIWENEDSILFQTRVNDRVVFDNGVMTLR